MPIQPLAPTLRLNSRENDPLLRSGEKVPASISWRRKARTSWRNSLASGGSSIGSKRKLKLINVSVAHRHPHATSGLSGANLVGDHGTGIASPISSWPGLTRPPTPWEGKDKDVDARIKSVQDDLQSSSLDNPARKPAPVITILG